jgi:hypothetical protein
MRVSDYTAKLFQAQGRSIDEVVLAKVRSGRSLYEKVALRVEIQERAPLDLISWRGDRAETSIRVRVVRHDLSWFEFQQRARALRDAGVL